MTTTTAELVTYEDPVPLTEQLAIAGFLAGYTGNTRTGYATDLRIYTDWCHANQLNLLGVRRVHLELFARWTEAEGRMRSTVARRLSTLASFYRYGHAEGIIARDPAVNVRRPKVDHESRTLGLDRNELGALLVQAGLATPRDHALVTLLAMNGLRISEALNADIDALDTERGHRTLRIVRKGGKHVTVPLAPRTARALDLYLGELTAGPIFLTTGGQRMDRSAADRVVKRLARRAGFGKQISPHSLRHTFITLALDAGVALRDVQEAASHADPRTTMRHDRGRQPLDRHATYIVAASVAGASRTPTEHPPTGRVIPSTGVTRHRRKCSGRARPEGRDYRRLRERHRPGVRGQWAPRLPDAVIGHLANGGRPVSFRARPAPQEHPGSCCRDGS